VKRIPSQKKPFGSKAVVRRGVAIRNGCPAIGLRMEAGRVTGIEAPGEPLAAGAVVTRDVGPREVVMGVPARVVRTVPDDDLIERWR